LLRQRRSTHSISFHLPRNEASELGPKATFSFSAVFAEVHPDPDLGLGRLSRFVGAYDCGRVINPKTARGQAIGGIIWGVGHALLERTETDPTVPIGNPVLFEKMAFIRC
jgi:CO/xanthine dehydrogenase Mo-binding subunit